MELERRTVWSHDKGVSAVMKKRPYILVVDDDKEILRIVKRSLALEGFGVATAADGKQALNMMEGPEPDLVILDIMMPQLDGLQVLNIMRQHSNVPVIMLTAKGEVTSLREALMLGADDYVRKPFRTRELIARVRAKLRRAGSIMPQLNREPTAEC